MNELAFETFWGHAGELRSTLIKCLAVILVCILCCFFFHQKILKIVISPFTQNSVFGSTKNTLTRQSIRKERIINTTQNNLIHSFTTEEIHILYLSSRVAALSPLQYQIPPGEYLDVEIIDNSPSLVLLGPLEGISMALKVSGWVGFILASPLWLFYLLQFIRPALNEIERRVIFPFLGLSFLFMAMGSIFAFYVMIPLANFYFENFNKGIGINLWTLSHYLNFSLFLWLANALAFELGVILFLLVHYEFISTENMISKRRYMIVLAFILGAILSPPDIITQIALAFPIIGLYEMAVLYSKFCKSYQKTF